ncbi:ergothioneine biosynthesis glutamate--cysteine ligase EgtA [Streptomyces profundus]|uniref:ergothioneine biosynthesis glutamate--cysteine ligase EgtA n=1 Tax=Streptomyces profundus TaxID=2867410 RepID=UPI001D16D4DF|nr:ergothioneine biosynthesis glutamate--cysteine ligase EgtA [Streptomyces sp. MA3_2.13]
MSRPATAPSGPWGPTGSSRPGAATPRAHAGARHPDAPSDAPPLSERDAEEHVARTCVSTGAPTRTGVELEWLVRRVDDPAAAVPAEAVRAALAPLHDTAPRGDDPPCDAVLPGGGRLTREPGGQVEISSAPGDSLVACVRATRTDLARLRDALAAAGLEAVGLGLDPYRDPPRVLHHPRYQAMESFFDRQTPGGRLIMRATASVQISVDAGDDSRGPTGYRARWALTHRLGPVLIAAFANSPVWRGRPTGWRSTRQALWSRLDPGRTRPFTPDAQATTAPEAAPDGEDPRAAWARYALDASLLCVRRGAPAGWYAPPNHSFRSWLRGPTADRRAPTLADLDYHLSTLFPPVRPRGWWELRMIDAQPGDDWVVPLAVTSVLLDDPLAADAARRATEPLTRGHGAHAMPSFDLWLRAARHGPADPELGPAVRACFAAADAALARLPDAGELRDAVAAFANRYVEHGRCPADDQLDALGTPLGPPPRRARRPGRPPPAPPDPATGPDRRDRTQRPAHPPRAAAKETPE